MRISLSISVDTALLMADARLDVACSIAALAAAALASLARLALTTSTSAGALGFLA